MLHWQMGYDNNRAKHNSCCSKFTQEFLESICLCCNPAYEAKIMSFENHTTIIKYLAAAWLATLFLAKSIFQQSIIIYDFAQGGSGGGLIVSLRLYHY